MASLEVNVKVLCLHLKDQWHKAKQGNCGRNTDRGETQSNRIGVIKDLLVDLLRRRLSQLAEGMLSPNYTKEKLLTKPVRDKQD